MNLKIASVLAGIVLTASAAPAAAQHYVYGDGSVKDAGAGGVAVPAPVPIPVYKADYYLRGDIGFGLTQDMGLSEEGLIYGQDAVGNDVTMPSSWAQDDAHWPMTFGIGVGRYWSDRFRTDLTLDWVRQQNGVFNGTMDYQNLAGDVATASIRDETTKDAAVFLANAYFDFGAGEERRFTPYIGAGVGFAVNLLDRNSYVSQDICNACGGAPTHYESSADNKTTTVSLAAAAMVGFTYDLGRSMMLDVNYRYLHIGGSDITVAHDIDGVQSRSKMSFDAQNEHQIRAGLRLNID